MNYFTFDGIDSRDYNTYIATSNAFDAPGREDEVIKVPGSNNIYYLTEGTYKPFDIKLYCYIPSNMQVKTDDLRNFLLSKGTCTYTEAIRPGEFRVARFIEAYEIDVSDRVSAAFVLTFKAQPQRYLTTNTPITTTATADTTTDTTMSLSTVPTPINISLNGNTTQEGSSGKNLLGLTNGTYTHNGITAVVSDGLVTYSGSTNSTDQALIDIPIDIISSSLGTLTKGLQPTGTYTGLQTSLRGSNPNTSAGLWSNNGSNNTGTLSENAYYFRIQVGVSITVNGKILPQIEKGSTATAYEPHISPTNPQVIHNVSGDNTVNVTSKNILSPFTVGIGLDANTGAERTASNTATTDFISVDFIAHPYYYISGLDATLHTYICAYNSYKQFLHRTGSTFRDNELLATSTFIGGTPQGIGDIAFLRVTYSRNSGDTGDINNVNNHLSQLEVGSTATTYEPYTRQSYPLYLPVENLLSRRTTRTTNGVTFTVNADGTITTSGTATANIYNALATLNLPNDTYTMTGSAKGGSTSTYYMYTEPHYRGDTGNGVTFTDSITSCSIFVASGQNMDGKVFKPQLEKGSHANHYTPYGTAPIELNKIGTYQDYIYKNGGKWYVHKVINKVDLGTLSWVYNTSYAHPFFVGTLTQNIVENTNAILSTSYTYITFNEMAVVGHDSGITAPSATQLRVSNYSYTDATAFKNASNGVLTYYPLATPTNTEITDTTLINQLNNIEKAYSYNGTTNILQVSNDNGFMLEVVSLHSNDVNSDYKGEPIITVNSTGLIYFNGCVIKVNQAPMTINSQTMQAYNGVINLNNYIEANDFPMIEAGTNVIGSEMPLSIVPNYWKL